ncbi:hypothetical protein C8R47DRAFT_961063 [Mycena vitilis]|nr:hypothetical protein C8R47DRAFT_961063 [Mycena vitilis]
MVYRAISEDLKARSLWLLEAGYITEEVCELLGVSRRSLFRWKASLGIGLLLLCSATPYCGGISYAGGGLGTGGRRGSKRIKKREEDGAATVFWGTF